MFDVATIPPPRRPELLLAPLGDRGQYVVKDPHSGEFYNFGEEEHFLLTRLDGQQTAETIWAAFEQRFGEALSDEDLQGFLALARARGFLESDQQTLTPGLSPQRGEGRLPSQDQGASDASVPPDGSPTVAARKEQTTKPKAIKQSILYWRKSLFDPDRLFDWLEPKVRLFWTPAFFVFSAGCILVSLALVWANSQALVSYFAHALRWETLAMVYLTMVVVTTCHEFAHGLTCKRYGGEVHEIGFLMMFFMPCFYCNVSDAWLFREKSKRVWVTLAGGYCELCVWALSVMIWRLTLQDSLLNYLAWVVLSVTGVRMFFNFNPLLKLDGYYLLGDLVEIPNLRQRAFGHVSGHLRWLLWGARRPARDPRGKFLLSFGIASWLFSLVFLSTILMAMGRFLWIRVGLIGIGCAVVIGLMVLPRLFQGLFAGEVSKMIRFRHKRTAMWITALGAMPLGLWLGQMQDRATGSFELRPVARAELRAPVAGFLAEIHVEEGDRVSTETLVARIEVPDLASRLAQKRAEVREVEAKLHLLEAGPRQEELDAASHRAQRAEEFRDLAKKELVRAGEVLREELTRLDEKNAQCRAELEHARTAHDRLKKLVSNKAVSYELYQEAVTEYRVSYTRLRQAEAERRGREAMGTIEAEAELARRETALADIEATLLLLEAGTRVEEIEAERAHLARLEEEVRYFETLGEKLLIKSPLAGAVSTPRLKEQIGRYLQEGELICEVEGTEAFEAEIALDEQEAARVRPGQRVELKARALPFRTFSGKVDRIAQRSTPGEAQSTVTVCCRFEDETSQLRPGMTGYARIYGESRSVAVVMAERVLRVVRTEFWW